jgi:CheY-like chemotaxis protein
MGARETSPQDRRHHFRAEIGGGVVVHVDGFALRGQLANLSLGGALIALHEHPGYEPGPTQHVRVEFELGKRGWISQHGRVQRITERELAIAFHEVAPDVEDVIEDQVLAAVEARTSPRVVVVDPHPARRRRVSDTLRAAGCVSLEAATPLEAIAMVEEPRNHVAAIAVTDEVRDAGPLVAYLSDSNPGIPVAMLGAAADDDSMPRSTHRARTEDELAAQITERVRHRP